MQYPSHFTDNELFKRIVERIHPSIWSQMLFFDHWDDSNPPDFTKLTSKQRAVWMQKLMKQSVAPTKSNYWIWFGSYVGKERVPQINRLLVVRHLYENLIAPIDGNYVRNILASSKADINPYKRFHAAGKLTKVQHLAKTKQEVGTHTVSDLLKENHNSKVADKIDKVVDRIKEMFYPGTLDTRSEMKETLKEEFHELILDEALKKAELPWKD